MPAASALDTANRERVEAHPGDYVEIPFVHADEQKQWIEEFIHTAGFHERERRTLQQLFGSVGYSSQVNTTFSAALGERATDWRRLRTDRILARVRDWAHANSLPLHEQEAAGDAASISTSDEMPADRKVLHKIIDHMTLDEIRELRLPAMAVVRALGEQSSSQD